MSVLVNILLPVRGWVGGHLRKGFLPPAKSGGAKMDSKVLMGRSRVLEVGLHPILTIKFEVWS